MIQTHFLRCQGCDKYLAEANRRKMGLCTACAPRPRLPECECGTKLRTVIAQIDGLCGPCRIREEDAYLVGEVEVLATGGERLEGAAKRLGVTTYRLRSVLIRAGREDLRERMVRAA